MNHANSKLKKTFQIKCWSGKQTNAGRTNFVCVPIEYAAKDMSN